MNAPVEVEIAAADVVRALEQLGGTATAAQLGEAFGGYEGGVWTSRTVYLRIRDALRNLRARGAVDMSGSRRSATYSIAPPCCLCGHSRAEHTFDEINPAGECVHWSGADAGETVGGFCPCEQYNPDGGK